MLSAEKAAAAAATEAFDANLDLVLSLGWAHMEARSHQIFQDEVEKAPKQLQGPLRSLALLYGLTRVERSAAFFLANGALSRPHFQVWSDLVSIQLYTQAVERLFAFSQNVIVSGCRMSVYMGTNM